MVSLPLLEYCPHESKDFSVVCSLLTPWFLKKAFTHGRCSIKLCWKNSLFSGIQETKWAYYKVGNGMQHDIIPRYWNYVAKRLDKASWDASHRDVSFLYQGSWNSYLKYISCWAMKAQICKLGFFYFFLKKKLVKLWKWKPLSLYDYCSLLSKMDFRCRNISPSNGAFQNHSLTFSLMQVQMPPDSWRFEAC